MTLANQDNRQVANRDETNTYEVTEGAVLHGHDNLRPPVLVLAQSQSLKGEAGQFIRMDTEEIFPTVEVVPIRVQPTQTYWGEGDFSRDRNPLCFSTNGRTSVQMVAGGVEAAYPGAECRQCERFTNQPWNQKSKDGWCAPGYYVLVFSMETYETFVVRLNGAATKMAKVFAAPDVFRNKAVNLYAEEKLSDSGKYYELKARVGRKLDDGELETVAGQFRDYRNEEATVVDVPVAEPGARPVASTPAQPATNQTPVSVEDETTEINKDDLPW